ncbi:LysR family transcriptional regulator [uncultured Clostridium sp.]|uniref:LysR family transcriptional regulator n=1 Tax=uncultured Clostridium sp. TaxID=59620 RepID=UPI0025F8632B|nr:LysR family transcriptional regulator [uncultured Clostridium sp.]
MLASFDSYRVFYITAKNESITAAAKELYVTQPTVTHCIQKLEKELGCTLFIRGKKGVKLTSEGNTLYKHVSVAYNEIMTAENEINMLKKFKKGEIVLGASETTLHHVLFPYLKRYKQKYPNVRMKIHNSSTPDMLEAVRSNKLDCAILVFPIDYQEEGLAINTMTLFQDIAIGGTDYEELGNSPVSLKDLNEYPIITISKGTSTNSILKEIFKQNNLELKPDIELATTDLVVPTVANNLGIGFVPEFFAEESLKKKEIIKIDLIENIPKRKICLVYKVGKPKSIAVDAFIQSIMTPL